MCIYFILNLKKRRDVNMSIFEGIKNMIIDIKDEIEMSKAEPLSDEERDRINSAYDWRCIGVEEE